MKQSNNNVYIQSLEGADIYSHVIRNDKIKDNFCGMIPFSLELIKLKSEGLQFKINKTNNKELSRDIINVKFKFKVKDSEYINKTTNDKITVLKEQNENEKNIDKKRNVASYILKLEEFILYLAEEMAIKDKDTIFSYKTKDKKTKKEIEVKCKKWDEINNQILREYLYDNGFTITTVDKKINKNTGEITENVTEVKYVVYKRSSSKSRTGQCLFIKESLCKSMINWSRMYLPFIEGMEVDYPGLLAYESLVGSSLESTIKINPKNILIVNDVESKFMHNCNIIKKDETTGFLGSFEGDFVISNSLFDGESLLDSSFYEKGQSMLLLRNHMFKSASFNCNIQQYLKDNCPEGIEFENWKIKNMFNQPILAKNILMICTPTSLKALKFDLDLDMTKKAIWKHWKDIVKKEGSIFGVCKHEKESKRGKDDLGNILQQTSYQMVNSLPASFEDMEELTTFERDYISKLKNDDEFFLNFALENANDINSNLMFVEIAKRNKDFMNTKIFRDFRKGEINSHVTHCKSGKIRLNGDYCILLGNPMEYLQHAIGKFDIDKVDINNLPLKGNEIYTKLYDDDGLELVCFRNPHTGPSNILIGKNTKVDNIDKYFNLSKNIVCVNAIKFPIQDILSSCDYDSDNMVIFNDFKILEIVKKTDGKYNVCVNDVKSEKTPYNLTTKDMCVIDNQLATSQRNIGKVVNTGQLCMSTYWDIMSKGETQDLSDLIKSIDIVTVLSSITIDMAKKLYDLDIDKEIRNIAKTKGLRKLKPTFWKNISQSNTIKDRVLDYDCPMDFLNTLMSKLPYPVVQHKNIDLSTLLIKQGVKFGNRNQEQDIVDYVGKMCTKINFINAENGGNEDYQVEERNNLIDDTIKYYNYHLSKKTVKKDTMYSILNHMIKNNESDIQTKLLNILFTTQKDVFLNTFRVNNDKNIYTYFTEPLLQVGYMYVKRFPYGMELLTIS